MAHNAPVVAKVGAKLRVEIFNENDDKEDKLMGQGEVNLEHLLLRRDGGDSGTTAAQGGAHQAQAGTAPQLLTCILTTDDGKAGGTVDLEVSFLAEERRLAACEYLFIPPCMVFQNRRNTGTCKHIAFVVAAISHSRVVHISMEWWDMLVSMGV